MKPACRTTLPIFILLFAALQLFPQYAIAEESVARRLGLRDTQIVERDKPVISQTQVWAITEGDNGYIFFATNDGLCVWDGVRWRYPKKEDNPILRALYYDKQTGRLYSAGVNEFGYWTQNSYGRFDYTRLYRNESFKYKNYDFWRIVALPDNEEIYFECNSNIFIYSKINSLSNDFSIRSIVPNTMFRYMYVDANRLCYQDGQTLYRVDDAKRPQAICDVDSRVINIFRNSQNEQILAVEHAGLMVVETDGSLRSLNRATNRVLSNAKITCCSRYDEDRLLVGTTRQGFFIIDLADGGIDQKIRYNNEVLSERTVLSAAADSKGNIWLGLNMGIAHVDNSSNEFYIRDKHIGQVFTLLECRDGSLLLGTSKGLFRISVADKTAVLIPGSLGAVWKVVEIGSRIYVLHDQGVFSLTGNVLSPVKICNGALTIEQFPNANDEYLVGQYDGMMLMRMEPKGLTFVTQIGNYRSYSDLFRIDERDRVWLPIAKCGFVRMTLSQDRRQVVATKDFDFFTQRPTPPQLIFSTIVDRQLMLCGGQDAYTIDYEQDTLVRNEAVSRMLSLCGKGVRALMQDDNNFWYIAEGDIGYVERSGNRFDGYSGIFESILPKERMSNTFFRAGSSIAVGFTDGVGFFSGHGHTQSKPELGYVSASGLNGEIYYDKREQVFLIPSSMNTLQIYPTNLGPSRFVEYCIDDTSDWHQVRIDEYLRLASLPYGSHTIYLRIPGREDQAQWLPLHIDIANPWYISTWAIVSYLLSVFLLLVAMRFYYIRANRRALESLRQRELERRRQELQKLEHDNLIKERQILEMEKEQLSSNLRNASKRLANITLGNIKRNNMLNEIKSEVQEITKIDTLAKLKNATGRILRIINNQMNDDSTWPLSERYFNTIYDGLLDKLICQYPQLSQTDLKLCVYIKLNLSTKEVAELMNISPRSVEMARYRLRKKLGLGPDDNIWSVLQ